MRIPKWAIVGTVVACCVGAVGGCSNPLPPKVRRTSNLGSPSAGPPQVVSGTTVLLVHSYHPEYPWTLEVSSGIKSVLEPAGVQVETIYLDTKRRTSESWKVQSGRRALDALDKLHPDAVIAADDNAQQYFGIHLVGAAVPLVFCGVNADPSKYGYPSDNVTGIIERPNLKNTVALANELVPMHTIAVLSSKDPTSIGVLNFMKQEVPHVSVVEWKLVSRMEDWKEAVLRYNESVDGFAVYTYHTLTSGDKRASVSPQEVMAWTTEHALVPTMGFLNFGIEDGLLLGMVESGFEQGEWAAEYIVQILRGVPIGRLPILRPRMMKRMVNRVTAKRLGLELPEGFLDGTLVVPTE